MHTDRHLGFRMGCEIHDKLRYISSYEGRSMSGQIVYLIQTCIREFEKEHGSISEEELKSALL
ncbi:hypothetical protein [Vermiculatibacterium agrestimuris]|uniref:hypothetical protein n=1 Tax=Vermiculatibacterium agrestimuris TaxID=2941519 RepID=UPI0020414744|nr:hypothetical protein [Vermiculatibacterium agrestimuris]